MKNGIDLLITFNISLVRAHRIHSLKHSLKTAQKAAEISRLSTANLV
jgi:hypothetical protein